MFTQWKKEGQARGQAKQDNGEEMEEWRAEIEKNTHKNSLLSGFIC